MLEDLVCSLDAALGLEVGPLIATGRGSYSGEDSWAVTHGFLGFGQNCCQEVTDQGGSPRKQPARLSF